MTQPTALFLADILEDAGKPADIAEKSAVELRRLHAELERCKQVCAATSEAWREEAALAEPVQEQPVCDECGKHKRDGWALYCVGCVEPMFSPPQRQAEPVQEPVQDGKCKHCVDGCPACDARKLPVQEPVAILHRYPSKASLRVVYTDEITEVDEGSWPLYLHPPRREWRGLTRDERMSIINQMAGQDWVYVVDAIEAALKERNA